MARFVKGQTKAGPGRPKGSKDRSFLTLEHWNEELKKDWPKLKPAQRAKLSAQLMQMLVNKMKALPSDPKDSVRNIDETMKILEEMEKGNQTEVGGSKMQKNEELDHNSLPSPEIDSTKSNKS